MKRSYWAALWCCVFCASAFGADPAFADSAVAVECSGKGTACTAYRPFSSSPGTCEDGTCWTCDGDHAVKYACPRCELPSEIGQAGIEENPRDPPPTCHDDSGCAVEHVGTEPSIAVMMLALGLGALALSRRRK